MRVVLDTNIWVSSLLLPNHVPGRIIAAWQHALFGVVISTPILEEIKRVLTYPKIQKRLLISPEEIEEYLTLIRFLSESIELNAEQVNALKDLRDKQDRPILGTLIASKADYLVTGDKDLLVHREQFSIIPPYEFVQLLE